MARHIKTKIRSDSLSLQPASSAPAARRDRATKRRVFHRKKVVQLSRNNHCHAILKSVFFFLRCLLFSPLTMIHAAWYFPHSHFFHQNDVWESSRNGREEDEPNKTLMRPSLLSLHFFFFGNIQLLRFLSIPHAPAPTCSTIILNKVIFVTFRWPQSRNEKCWS